MKNVAKKRYVFATVGTLMFDNFLIEKRARTDYFGAFGPSASLTLGSPCGRSTWPHGQVVEPARCLSGVRIENVERHLAAKRHSIRKSVARPERFELPTTWFEGSSKPK